MQVTFDIPAQKITIEGEEPELVKLLTVVRDIAPHLPNINIVATTASPQPQESPRATFNGLAPVNGSSGSGPSPGSMRDFIRSLQLENTSEKIAAIAYYLKVHMDRPVVSPREMNDFFTQCNLQKPSQMPVAFFDAKRKYGFIENFGHGSWKLSTQGENLVAKKLEERHVKA